MEDLDLTNSMNDLIRHYRLIAIMRHLPEEQLIPVFQMLADAGVRLIEITMNTKAAAEQINLARTRFGGRMLIGAGTVSTPERATEAMDAGAQFLVTPNLDPDVLDLAKKRSCPVVCGVLTPTEMMAAIRAGASTLKIFPAGRMGTGYIKDILAPLNDLNLVAVGGVTADNAADWIRAGCIGIGMGSSLLNPQLIQEGRYDELGRQTEALLGRLK
ncbi:MAG: bifunctional 4-hydroxy-2-oxoglutarate aldolase/2-dehydro-3-deoxy-phosphogluconate aldolase [Clostridiaceae bacterium]|nr:bifunctional 4-hydroxy-2-oxoglutarate aldolase/2-dehydro-3-deoxy-phosphogluconate aldolase [Clostridiaceae bacterium]